MIGLDRCPLMWGHTHPRLVVLAIVLVLAPC
jgi:hypothetical protein